MWWGLIGIGPREGVLLGANLGRAIVTSGDFTASVCDSASTVGAAFSGGACGGPRHCCIRWGSTSCKGNGGLGVFVSHFHNGKCHWVADGEMFLIRMRKLHNISVQKLDSWAFWRVIFGFNIKVGVYEKLAKSNDCSARTQVHAATLATTPITYTRLFLELHCAGVRYVCWLIAPTLSDCNPAPF